MLKHLVHSHHGKLHTFDDFYRNDTKPIKSRSLSNELISTTNVNSSSPSPTSPSSPNSNPYTFYNVFSDLKCVVTTPDVVLEEDETEENQESIPPTTPVFYLEDDHHTSPSSSSSPHWPSLILNRFRHPNSNGMIKQNSVNENQMISNKLRKSDLTDSSIIKHRFLKRSETVNHSDKKCLNDDFPELSAPIGKKHRSFVSLFHHFHTEHSEPTRHKLIKQKTLPSTNELNSPVSKTPSAIILPKLASLFHRHHTHLSEHHKYRVGNLKARLHHRRHSPPLTNIGPKFQCQASNELIQQLKQSEEEEQQIDQNIQRPVKPVIMKRVHTWHNTFDLRPVDQDSFHNRSSDDDDRAFEQFLQEHQTPKPAGRQQRRKNRNSLKDFIRDSSSSSDEEHPLEFYPKVNRLLNDDDSSWRKDEDVYASDQSSSSSESDNRQLIPKKKDLKIAVNFLESLSNHIPNDDKHTDAKPYFIRTGFKNKPKRQQLADKLFSIFNEDVFSSKLSDKVTVVWSGRLTATAGHCTTRRSAQTAIITLSHKVCDSPERCRDTLLHEMCHAAVSLIDGVTDDGHGPVWRHWTRRAERCYPYLPAISVKHTYDIAYKFVYRCNQCQYEVYRHSKSLDLEGDRCGKCMGRLELFLNNAKTNEVQTPKKTLNRYNLFIKEHFQTTKQAQPHLSTPQLMKHLSQEYKKKMQQPQIDIDLPDLEQLKI